MNYFDGIKVGDRVWSAEFGWGGVKFIHEYMSDPMIEVSFPGLNTNYDLNGKRNLLNLQTLFWDEIKIIPPPRPKKKVKKKESMFVFFGLEESVFIERKFAHCPTDMKIYPCTVEWEEEE